MTTFDDREAAFENKHAYDAQQQFRLEARADKKIAIWAAEKLGKTGDAVDAYISEVIRADMQEAGAEDVVAKVAGDLGPKSSAEEVRAKYADFFKAAQAELADS
nr:DUF1476 domain-containing protein [uncultured Celeribacter sp.]